MILVELSHHYSPEYVATLFSVVLLYQLRFSINSRLSMILGVSSSSQTSEQGTVNPIVRFPVSTMSP